MLPSPLTPVLSSGSLPSHQAKVKEHYLSHAQTYRIWVDSHASDTRSHTTLAASQEGNREFKPVTPHSPGEVSRTQHLLLFEFSILQLTYLFLEKGEQGEEEFLQRTLFCLLWLQPYYLSEFSIHQQGCLQKQLMSRRQVESPLKFHNTEMQNHP